MPKKILLADDSITIQKVVELTFSDGDYEVTAVNNGAKAVQKLAEMRPDIILSDIIMPEKNGYEVCEYVKSHPDFRNIPVVLLTGTFEPFDPDRAEKAGCDAVVTKPFESQSLIHKVEELIASAQSASAPAAEPEPEPAAASPWMDDTPAAAPSAFSTASGDAFTHDADIFGAAPTPEATTEMPFELPSSTNDYSGETRAFPRMSFEELSSSAASATPAPEPEAPAAPAAPSAPEPSPWDEPADAYSGETRAFQKMSFDDFAPPAPAPAPEAESPFGAPAPSDDYSGETRAFPRMSFEELSNAASSTPAPEPETPATPEPSPWNEPEAPSPFAASSSPFGEEDAPAFGGETRAFPKLSFDDMQQMAASTPPQPTEQEPAPWGDPGESAASPFGSDADAPAFGGETRAFPKLSFDDFQQSAPAAEPEPEMPPIVADLSAPAPSAMPWSDEPEPPSPFAAPADEPAPVESLWSPTSETNALDTPAAESFSTAAALPFSEPASAPSHDESLPEDLPFATETTPVPEAAPEPSWSPVAAAEAAAEPDEPVVPPPALAPDAPPMAIAARGSDLSDEQIDRIARRVVELMSDSVVRNIAWEVIPDLAEMVVKERIRQLEAEA